MVPVTRHGSRPSNWSGAIWVTPLLFYRFAMSRSTATTGKVARATWQVTMSSMRVLLVDDHADTLKVMVRLLTHFGHDVTTAGTVAEAAAKCGEFDLLITDLGLPDGSGVEVLKQF